MEEVFLKLVNMSIAASWLILAVIILRLLLKKAPKTITLVLWAIVAVRLVCPLSFESVLSLIPSAQTIPQEFIYSAAPKIDSGITAVNDAVNPIISESLAPSELASANPTQIISFIAAIIWLVGIAAMLIYAAASYIRIHRKVRESIPDGDGIFICDRISAPFILGIFRPRIYLPSSLNEQDKIYVIAHEKAHINRRDYISKPLGFLLLSVYWFNPIIWIAYILFCKDIELCCDERVIKQLGNNSKKPYANALINCSTKRHIVSACPLAFGEVSVKSRIKSVLSYNKPAFWLIIAAVVACAITAVCFLTNPPAAVKHATVYEYKSSADPTAPSITLKDDGTFSFTYSSLISYFATGKYEMSSDTLTLKADDGKSVYIFSKKDDKYIFNAAKSSKIPELKYSDDSEPESPVPDGAVFEPKANNGNISTKDYSNKAFAFGTDTYAFPITDTTLREIILSDQDPNASGKNGEFNKDNEVYKKYDKLYSRKYKLYSEGKYIGEKSGTLDSWLGTMISVNFAEPINANTFIAVAGDDNIYPHPVSVSATYSNSTLISQMSKELKRTVKPIKNVACDIDNDGRDENIVTVTDGKDITAAALIDNDKIVSYISIFSLIGLDEDGYGDMELETDLAIELADTNGDGITELYCYLRGYEWVNGMVYTYKNGTLHSNLTGYDQETEYKNYQRIAPPGFNYDE